MRLPGRKPGDATVSASTPTVEADTSSAIYEGRFLYAGGNPRVPKVGAKMSGPKVRVTAAGIEYSEFGARRRGLHRLREPIFHIERSEVVGVRHDQAAPGFSDRPDQFIVVEMEVGGRTFAVRFKAEGVTAQKDAFAFYAAVTTMIAGS